MHTNSEVLVGGGLSFPVAIGHVDFWPNGGVSQPVSEFYPRFYKHITIFTSYLCNRDVLQLDQI